MGIEPTWSEVITLSAWPLGYLRKRDAGGVEPPLQGVVVEHPYASFLQHVRVVVLSSRFPFLSPGLRPCVP